MNAKRGTMFQTTMFQTTMFESGVRRLARRGVRVPGELLLASARRRVLAEVVARHRAEATTLGRRLRAGADTEARDELDALATRALGELRHGVAHAGVVPRIASMLDQAWHKPDAVELMDRPELDEARRTRIIESLDRWNVLSGSYDLFLGELRPLLRPDGPTRVLDLASGHAGFALHLLRVARDQGLDLQVTATDCSAEYLEVGRARAAAEGLSLDVRVQDALDLTNLAPGEFDIVTCTQAQHHFPAGLVAVMFETAARAAGRGVVFIDGSRSAMHAITMLAMGQLYFRQHDFTHDSVVSLRRFFYPEELQLLTCIGPWGDRVEARWMPPNHCLVRLDHTRG